MLKEDLVQDLCAALGPEERLLLATAKSRFEKSQISEIQDLAAEVADWGLVAETSVRKFSAPYLYEAVKHLPVLTVPQDALNLIIKQTQYTRLRSLKFVRALIKFHQQCIAPARARHAYIKGPALSVQFGGKVHERFCRDLDVLIDDRDFARVVTAAHDHGYKIALSLKPLKLVANATDLEFVTSFPGDISLISPEGVVIEIHGRLEKKNKIFDTEDALSSTESIVLGNTKIRTLRAALHFNYVCYHHSRHYWSHLHWLVDLDLMARSLNMDREEARRLSELTGLKPTFEAAMELQNCLSHPSTFLDVNASSTDLTREFLKACVTNLKGGLELEYALRENSFGYDFFSKAQVSANKLRQVTRFDWKDGLRPVLPQYAKRPLPRQLFWLYRVQRVLILFRDWATKKSSYSKSGDPQ